MQKLRFFGSLIVMLTLVPTGSADVFKWVDDDGNVHYGDSPPHPHRSEQMELHVDQPNPSDEGELRRRRLLEQADKDAQARLQRRRDKNEERRNVQQQKASVDAECMGLRSQLEVLKYQMPVYRDEEGQYRVKWEQDAYQGKRIYIDDSTRARVMKQIRKQIASRCTHQNQTQAQRTARTAHAISEHCETARAELREIDRPSTRATDDELEQRRRRVQYYCGK